MSQSPPRESVARTLLVAAAVALACSAMVSGAVHWLKPRQAAHELVERNRALLAVAGLLADDATDEAVTSAYLDLDARVWDRQAREFADLLDGHSYDHWAQPAADADDAIRYVPVYTLREQPVRIVLPVHGDGMWSKIYGYVALGSDYNTVAAVRFHRHGETPGIGDRIQDPQWLTTWQGKRIYDADGQVRIRVAPASSASAASKELSHHIDIITGASVTSEKVGELVRAWMGPDGYAPLLDSMRQQDGRR